MLLGLALCSLVATALHILISFQEKNLTNALSDKSKEAFYGSIQTYFLVIVVAVPFFAFFTYLQDLLALRWRTWLTNRVLDKYFAYKAYYTLHQGFYKGRTIGLADESIDNPDQRISEDIRTFTAQSITFLLLILQHTCSILGFVGILFSISPMLVGFLIVYAVGGTLLTVQYFGRRLVPWNAKTLESEASFRYALVRLSDHAESVAFYAGEKVEHGIVQSRFKRVCYAMENLILWQRQLALFKNTYHYLTYLIPPLIIGPQYLRGDVTLGAVSQSSMAFRITLSALTLIVQQFKDLSYYSAGIDRLYHLISFLEQHEIENELTHFHPNVSPAQAITRRVDNSIVPYFRLRNVTVTIPNQKHRILIPDLSLSFNKGDKLLVVGDSGTGKSSFLRTLAGLWGFGSGEITSKFDLQGGNDVIFLPQKPYMLLGTLRDQICYPYGSNSELSISDIVINEALKQVCLDDLVNGKHHLDEIKDWSDVLSLGEQQRIAFARVLVLKPKLVFLDEASSALDSKNETNLYTLLSKVTQSFISIGHRRSLTAFHTTVLLLNSALSPSLVPMTEFINMKFEYNRVEHYVPKGTPKMACCPALVHRPRVN